MDINDIEHIIKILKANEVTDFELEQEGTRIKLTRNGSGTFVASAPMMEVRPLVSSASPASGATQEQRSANSDQEAHSNAVKVESPIVGTFYRRSSPDAEVFVKEGDTVSKGDTLCIVEAMKLMNEIEAPTSGRIAKILGSEGQVVEFGEVLFLIDPSI